MNRLHPPRDRTPPRRNLRSDLELKPLRPFELPASPFHQMRLAATLLLVAMALVFIATLSLETTHPALPWVQAFAEAALVGGLADWFAVTALFRHPLGLPIPHTAIIPANKDRIGDSLASFLKDNFLTPTVVARRLDAMDIAAAIARWLVTEPPPASGKRRGFGPLVARLIEALDQKDAMLEHEPKLFFTTPHYDGHPVVLVKLEAVDVKRARALIAESYAVRCG
jgi:hypothetical protein